MKRTALIWLALTLLLAPIADAKTKKKNKSAKKSCITAEADALFEALRPLTKSCARVGALSAHWYMHGSAWNSFSHDEQQQLMDEVASKQAIQDADVTIHVYVSSTDVGKIGPGWSGQWKFRRNDD